MTTRRQPETVARQALWLGGLLVVLAGLFSMHGLTSHGVSGMESMPQPVLSHTVTGSAMSAVGAVDDAKVSVHAVGSAVATATVAAGHSGMGMGMGMGMAGMCLAVLAVALIALLRLLRRSPVHPILWVLPRPARAPGNRVRDLDPPSLIALSIQRC